MLPDFICSSSNKKSQNYPNNGMTWLSKGWIPTPIPIRLIVISSNPSKSSFIQNNLYASVNVTSVHDVHWHHWPGGGAPCVSRLTNCISTCPQDEFALPVQKKKEQIRQTELRDVQHSGKGDGFNRCSVYVVLIDTSFSIMPNITATWP